MQTDASKSTPGPSPATASAGAWLWSREAGNQRPDQHDRQELREGLAQAVAVAAAAKPEQDRRGAANGDHGRADPSVVDRQRLPADRHFANGYVLTSDAELAAYSETGALPAIAVEMERLRSRCCGSGTALSST